MMYQQHSLEVFQSYFKKDCGIKECETKESEINF